jgi:predicted ester cyclase
MSIEENKALVRRFLEAHAKGDLDTLEEMLATDFVDHNLIPGQQPGREGYLRALTEYHAAYSHTRYVIEKQLAEGEEVVTTFAVSATHDRGEWMGLVPAGKQFEALLILVHRIVGGKITDEWTQGSGLAELTQRRLEQEVREREREEQEMRVARSIQQGSLPEGVPTLVGSLLNRYIYIERVSSLESLKQPPQLWWRGRLRPRPPITPQHYPRVQPSSYSP